eukprot:TRINITY_DN3219_c0_g3_i1.p1 TRINITY_DN3219_c0_g3~~TRINITY_DN3219_c0_g3_i1.p1  ORF type:complete len:693 (-),score=142.66 TRINITY_DN3219_c0_g3_i1:567-2348(-)
MVGFYIREGIRVEGKDEDLNELRELFSEIKSSCTTISPLNTLCRNGTVDELKAEFNRLEMTKPDWEKPDKTGRTLLAHAVIAGNVEIVRFLVENCTPGFIETKEKNGSSVLNLAACSTNKKEIFDILLNNCDPTFKDSTMNVPGDSTPLFDAIMVGNVVAIESLLENSAPEYREIMIGGCPILHFAVDGNCIDCIPALLKNSRPEFRESIDESGNNALSISLEAEDNPKMISALLQNSRADFLMTINKNITCLGLAALHGRAKALRVLLEYAPLELIEYQDDQGVSVLHHLAYTLSPENAKEIAKMLLEKSLVLFNLITGHRMNAYVVAVCKCNLPVVKALIESLSEVCDDFVFENGDTPIHLALKISQLDPEFLKAVLDLFQSAEQQKWYSVRNGQGYTPFHAAVAYLHCKEIIERIFENSPKDIYHSKANNELTPFGLAVANGNAAAVDWFFKKWPQECQDARFQLDCTALHVALASNSVETIKAIQSHVTPEFRKLGNTSGLTALMMGIQEGVSVPLVHALLDGQPNLRTTVCKVEVGTSIHVATAANRLEILEILLSGLPYKYHSIGLDVSFLHKFMQGISPPNTLWAS